MAIWNKICCGVDFSEPSRIAVEEAATLAKQLDAELTLLHVYQVAGTAEMGGSLPELFPSAVKEVEHELEGWRAMAERLVSRPVRSKVVQGKAGSEIVRFAADEAMDAIVVATHGRTGIRRLVMGSVAKQVVELADCAVVVIRRPRPRIEPD
jgi:nucleotide-binding universal stress UspA family protein